MATRLQRNCSCLQYRYNSSIINFWCLAFLIGGWVARAQALVRYLEDSLSSIKFQEARASSFQLVWRQPPALPSLVTKGARSDWATSSISNAHAWFTYGAGSIWPLNSAKLSCPLPDSPTMSDLLLQCGGALRRHRHVQLPACKSLPSWDVQSTTASCAGACSK